MTVASFRLAPNHLVTICPHDPRSIFPACWWDGCDAPPLWDMAHRGCGSPHCGVSPQHGSDPGMPCRTGNHEHYCGKHIVAACDRWRIQFDPAAQ